MNKYIKIFAVIFMTLNTGFICSQITTRERPISFSNRSLQPFSASEIEVIVMPALNIAQLTKEDKNNENYDLPLRYGYPHQVDLNVDNSGTWTILSNGDKLWQLEVQCPKATSIDVGYDKLWIPQGSKFFVYSSDKKYTIGAITFDLIYSRDKNNPNSFTTGLIPTDKIIFEYYQPSSVKEHPIISIKEIIHGYKTISISANKNLKGDIQTMSTDNHININCPEGKEWQDHKNSVALIAMSGGICTGALLRTTSTGFIPMFLTANHCLPDGVDAVSNANLGLSTVYWNYEDPGCTNSVSDAFYYFPSTSGATLLANDKPTDFALLQLMQNPLEDIRIFPYYSGWSRSSTFFKGAAGTGIHHPAGKTKKMTMYTDVCIYDKEISWKNAGKTPKNTHLRATYLKGYTEGGSSGSPILNSDKRVIGQLHGGDTYYGRFDISWDGYNSTSDKRRRLKDWLDPENKNVMTTDGSYPIFISGPDGLCHTEKETYNLQGTNVNVAEIIWSIDYSNAPHPIPVISANGFSCVVENRYNQPGIYGLVADIKYNDGNVRRVRKTVETYRNTSNSPNFSGYFWTDRNPKKNKYSIDNNDCNLWVDRETRVYIELPDIDGSRKIRLADISRKPIYWTYANSILTFGLDPSFNGPYVFEIWDENKCGVSPIRQFNIFQYSSIQKTQLRILNEDYGDINVYDLSKGKLLHQEKNVYFREFNLDNTKLGNGYYVIQKVKKDTKEIIVEKVYYKR